MGTSPCNTARSNTAPPASSQKEGIIVRCSSRLMGTWGHHHGNASLTHQMHDLSIPGVIWSCSESKGLFFFFFWRWSSGCNWAAKIWFVPAVQLGIGCNMLCAMGWERPEPSCKGCTGGAAPKAPITCGPTPISWSDGGQLLQRVSSSSVCSLQTALCPGSSWLWVGRCWQPWGVPALCCRAPAQLISH